MPEKKTPKKAATLPAVKNAAALDTIQLSEGVDGVTRDMTNAQMMAAIVTRSALAGATLKAFSGCAVDRIGVTDLIGELRKAGAEVVGGDLGRVERMLVNQAITLDAVFNQLALRASKAEYIKTYEVHMRLAFKAQAQCRTTVEALALLKNPQPYIRQANIAQGPQQINNGGAWHQGAASGAGNYQSAPSKVLEARP